MRTRGVVNGTASRRRPSSPTPSMTTLEAATATSSPSSSASSSPLMTRWFSSFWFIQNGTSKHVAKKTSRHPTRHRNHARPLHTTSATIRLVGIVATAILIILSLSSFLTSTSNSRRSLLSQDSNATKHDDTATVALSEATVMGTHLSSAPRQHAIPQILIFTHSVNLLTTQLHDYTSKQAVVPGKNLTFDELNELVTLQRNVRNITALHPSAEVRFLTDDDCIASIRTFFQLQHAKYDGNNTSAGSTYPTTPEDRADELIRYFQHEPQGMFKADLCRGTALYETGGIYLDVDLGVRMPLWSALRPSTEFATVRVHRQSLYPGAFFQAFLATTPQHVVIERYVHLFVEYYRGQVHFEKPGPLGVLLLKRAYDEIQKEQKQQLQQQQALLKPLSHSSRQSPSPSLPRNVTHAKTRLEVTSELWQEILYAPHLQSSLLSHVPPPTWGRRRACKFVVAVSPTVPLVVPLYSRIAGSRMCPVEAKASTDPRAKTARR